MEKLPFGSQIKKVQTVTVDNLMYLKSFVSNPMTEEEKVNRLAEKIDSNMLGRMTVNFDKYAGADKSMDQEEYQKFMKKTEIPNEIADALWSMLDDDNSGTVERDELVDVVGKLQKAKAWLRFCPTCNYDHNCSYCQECAGCPDCTDKAWCAECWLEHSGRGRTKTDGDEEAVTHTMFSKEFFRDQMVIRPLEWAYTTESLPLITAKTRAKIRAKLREQRKEQASADHKRIAAEAEAKKD